jgi:ABC-type sugar transport system substrate-binding protein
MAHRRLGGIVLGLGWALTVAGCQEAPPPPLPFTPAQAAPAAEPGVAAAPGASGVREIPLVLPPESDSASRVWEHAALQQAGMSKVFVGTERAEVDSPPTRQAELLRQVVDRGTPVALLVPPVGEPPAELRSALEYARDKGTRVIVLGRALDPSAFPIASQVTHRPLRDQAVDLVTAALDLANQRGLKDIRNGPALIIENTADGDPRYAMRSAALRQALESVGIPVQDTLKAKAPTTESGAAVRARVNAPEPPRIVLTTDSWTLKDATGARRELKEPAQIMVGGFSEDEDGPQLVFAGSTDCIVDCNFSAPARTAVALAASLLKGEPNRPEVLIPTPIRVSERLPVPAISNNPFSPGLKRPRPLSEKSEAD